MWPVRWPRFTYSVVPRYRSQVQLSINGLVSWGLLGSGRVQALRSRLATDSKYLYYVEKCSWALAKSCLTCQAYHLLLYSGGPMNSTLYFWRDQNAPISCCRPQLVHYLPWSLTLVGQLPQSFNGGAASPWPNWRRCLLEITNNIWSPTPIAALYMLSMQPCRRHLQSMTGY